GIGSGHRAQPLSTATHDRFYALRDFRKGPLTQADFAALVPVTDAQLAPITDSAASVPADAPGWRLDLDDGGWRGEKVLAAARTFADEVWFTTYRPGGGTAADACAPTPGTQRIYRVRLLDGAPVANLDGAGDDTVLTSADRYVEREGGILPEAQLVFLDDLAVDGRDDERDEKEDDDEEDERDDDTGGDTSDTEGDRDDGDSAAEARDDSGAACRGDGCGAALVCVGTFCTRASFTNAPVRTYWRQEHVDE